MDKPTASLAELTPGQSGSVTEVTGDDWITRRLYEMGVTPGANIRVVALAPLGDPIEIEIRNYRLSLRKAEAERIAIRTDATTERSRPS